MTSPNPNSDSVAAELDELLLPVDALPMLDTRSDDEILGYEDDGVPG
ncbi:MAG TPA: hypothetical protein VGL74_08940 [Terriglobales bacterium]|jgi:hypothetical protein